MGTAILDDDVKVSYLRACLAVAEVDDGNIHPYNFEPVRNAEEVSESESGVSDDDNQTPLVPDTCTE